MKGRISLHDAPRNPSFYLISRTEEVQRIQYVIFTTLAFAVETEQFATVHRNLRIMEPKFPHESSRLSDSFKKEGACTHLRLLQAVLYYPVRLDYLKSSVKHGLGEKC